MIYEWIKTVNFEQCANVIRFGKIDGKTLLEASDLFYEDTLGLLDMNLSAKLKGEIDKVRAEAILDLQLYGWG